MAFADQSGLIWRCLPMCGFAVVTVNGARTRQFPLITPWGTLSHMFRFLICACLRQPTMGYVG